MTVLPPLRKKILHGYLTFVTVFGVLCTLLILSSVFIATGISPRIIHANYDSIEAARKMQQSWNALHFPQAYTELPNEVWIKQFDDALRFEFSNITEPGEDKISHKIGELWYQWKQGTRSDNLTREMNDQFYKLTVLNEKGMFE